MSTAFHRRKARQAQHDDNHSSSGGIRHRIIMSSITDEEMADSLSESNSTEPSLANSSVSNSSFSRHDSSIQNTSSSPTTTIEESRPQQYLHCSIPLHSNSSLLDMTRDDSHDDDNNVSTTEVQRDLDRDPLYRSPDTSLLDEHDDDHDHDNDNDNDHDDAEEDAVTAVGRSFANISASISGSFCTKGDEVGNCTLPDCSTYLSDKVAASSKKVLFSDVMLKDRIMTDFNYLLGSTTAPCCSEKNLFTDCFGAVPTVVTGVEHSEEEEAKIRNRAGESWRARAYRIKRLREERMIQDSSLPKSGNLLVEDGLSLQLEDGLMRSTSFSHHHQQKRVSISKPVSMKPKQEVNVEPLGCMIGDCIEPITLMEGNELEVEWKSRQEYLDEQDLCYDSDPGLPSRLNTLTSDQKGRRAVTPDAESMKLTYERSKSDSQVNSSSPPPPPPSAPKKKWFRSPRSRRRRMHFDSFDESLDNSIELDGNSHAATEREEALNLIREDFYGSENTSLDSPSSDSFEDHSLPRKIGPIGKRATTIHIDNEIRRNVQVCSQLLQFSESSKCMNLNHLTFMFFFSTRRML